MRRLLMIPLLLLPLAAGAATYTVPSSTVPENAYVAQVRVNVSQPVPADFVAAGAVVNVGAPVTGEVLAAGGTVSVMQGAGGDVRVGGGKVTVQGLVGGDVAAAGGTIHISSAAKNIYAAGGSVSLEGGSGGNVTIYGANVFLSGEYQGNVSVIASNRFTVGDNTHIHGVLKYSAPEALTLPATAIVDGGAKYTGAYAYVPTNQQAQRYALIGSIIFFFVRVLAGSIVAGLIAGLFLGFATEISEAVISHEPHRTLRLFLLGLALTILTPLLCLVLLISFVGAGLAILLIVVYTLLGILAYAFAGIALGLLVRKTLLYRIHGNHELSWQDAVLGTVLLHVIGLFPYIGTFGIFVLTIACTGALAHVAYRAAFGFAQERDIP